MSFCSWYHSSPLHDVAGLPLLYTDIAFNTFLHKGRNRNHQGLAAAIIELWERSVVVKIAVKRGIQNTNNLLMAEEIKVCQSFHVRQQVSLSSNLIWFVAQESIQVISFVDKISGS